MRSSQKRYNQTDQNATNNNITAILVIAFSCAVFFGRTIFFDFIEISDDEINVIRHHRNLVKIWLEPFEQMYIPIPYTVWTLLAKISPGPAMFHFVNVVTHCVNSWLVYLICFKLSGRHYGSLLGAIVFCLHPFQVEPVCWVTGLKDLLYCLFGFTALYMFLIGKRIGYIIPVVILSILCKPAGVVFPLVMMFLAFHDKKRRITAAWLILCCVPFLVMTLKIQPGGDQESLTMRLATAVDVIGFYSSRFFIPADLSADHARLTLMPFEMMTGIVVLMILSTKRPTGGIIALICLTPVLGLIAFRYQNWSNVADRYMYAPMLGVAICLTRIKVRDYYESILLVSYTLLIVLGTWSYVSNWKDVLTLHSHALGIHQDNYRKKIKVNSSMILGMIAERNGQKEKAQRYYGQALKLDYINKNPQDVNQGF